MNEITIVNDIISFIITCKDMPRNFKVRTVLSATFLVSCLSLLSLIWQIITLHHYDSEKDTSKISHKSEYENNNNVTIVLLRMIGNSLPPRHSPNQSIENLQFILENEPQYPGLEKHWVLNRIVREEILKSLCNLLHKYEENYTIVPFDLAKYQQVPLRFYGYEIPDLLHNENFILRKDFHDPLRFDNVLHDKNVYVININSVRNLMIDIGKYHYQADWILPWDGNCFVTPKAWKDISTAIYANGNVFNYMITPMNRLLVSNEKLLDDSFEPDTKLEEPQIGFHKTALARFDPGFRYGRRDKAELFIRLAIPGIWFNWWK